MKNLYIKSKAEMDAREVALKALIDISYNKDFGKVIESWGAKTPYRADFGHLVNGVIRNITFLDYFIEKISQRKPSFLQNDIRNILRLGFFELEFTQNPEYAVVNSYVDIVKKTNPKASSLVNAVFRNFLRQKDEIKLPSNFLDNLSIKYSHPKWMIKRWVLHYGKDEIESILKFNNTPYGLWIRINTLKISVNDFLAMLVKEDIEFEQNIIVPECIRITHKGSITNFLGFDEGFWMVQGVASSLVANILAPEEDDVVLDICAAPGGKTAHMAAMMNNTGRILALDSSKKRLERLEENLIRLNIENTSYVVKDATKVSFNEYFDKILIDAPCSNTGIFSKKPDAKWKKTIEDIEELSKIQYEILVNISKYLKPNGTMVYSTCSIELEENILVVHKFLQNNKDFVLEPFDIPYETEGTLQIIPYEFNMEGFFIAKFKRI